MKYPIRAVPNLGLSHFSVHSNYSENLAGKEL
jgi:hypothetical protein